MKFNTLLILPLLVASLQAASVDDLTFTLINGGTEYSVSDCLETASGSLEIPSTYNGLPVTSIGDSAFRGCYNLTIITIPDGVTSIGDYAFNSCSSLSSITIPDGVNSIGDYAFLNTSSLTSFTIPNSVNSIGDYAFRSCGLTSITIPDGVTSIGEHTFSSCYSLSSITIPDGVTSIGESAFRSCISLTSITIPASVNSIGFAAFQSCPNLTSVTFKGDAPYFSYGVFTSSDSVTIYFDSNYSGWYNGVAGRPAVQTNTLTFTLNGDGTEYSLSDCLETASGSLNIPSTYNGLPVTSIAIYTFENCAALTSLTIPDSVTSISERAANSCTSLTSINVSNSNSYYTVNNGVLYNKAEDTLIAYPAGKSEEEFTVPSSVTSIGDYAFSRSGLTSITIGDSVTSIGTEAFYLCSNLNSITIPDGVTSIGDNAFRNCFNLSSITIGDSVSSIGYEAFYNTGISFSVDTNSIEYLISASGNTAYLIDGSSTSGNVVLPNTVDGASVTLFAESAFLNCTSLISITIPDGVTSIAEGTFYGCTSLTNITIPDGVTSIGESAFRSCTSLSSVTIPNSVTSIGDYAFAFCSGLTTFTIPDSVTSIGQYVFQNCSNLASINIPDSVTSITLSAIEGCSSLTSLSFSSPLLEAAEAERDARPTQTAYDAVLAERDARPTQTAYDAVLAERDAKLTLDEVKDLRAGSTMIEVSNNEATIELEMHQSNDLQTWSKVGESISMTVPADSNTKFFRHAFSSSNSSDETSVEFTFIGTNNHDFATYYGNEAIISASDIPLYETGSNNYYLSSVLVIEWSSNTPIGGSQYGKPTVTVAATSSLVGHDLKIRFFKYDSDNVNSFSSAGPLLTVDGDALAQQEQTVEAVSGVNVASQLGFSVRVWKEAKP